MVLLCEARFIPAKLLQTSPPQRRGRDAPGSYNIIDLDLSRYDNIASRHASTSANSLSFLKDGIDTQNLRFNRLIAGIEKVAHLSPAPMLLTGATGVGKSALARRIYALKKQRGQVEGALVEVNCATLRGDGAMSALFGHAKGAFTGAQVARRGLLAAADKGLLFLDEIGELGLDEQAMLLRAIEEKTFLPMGSDKAVASDFQLIAGTNRDLRNEVRDGTFREDLLARINLWTFELPMLRERQEDIEPNLTHEIGLCAAKLGHRVEFNKEARTRFLDFARNAPWPGNFRDFHAAVERMATLAEGQRIRESEVEAEVERLSYAWRRLECEVDTQLERFLSNADVANLDLFDRVQLEEVLRVCTSSPSLSAASRTLFAASRTKKRSSNDADRLRKYLQRFGLTWSQIRA